MIGAFAEKQKDAAWAPEPPLSAQTGGHCDDPPFCPILPRAWAATFPGRDPRIAFAFWSTAGDGYAGRMARTHPCARQAAPQLGVERAGFGPYILKMLGGGS